tara:strand:+ start:16215 stop:17432 length:1218 start_codon:yes stop_codon:yes gene_type:complete
MIQEISILSKNINTSNKWLLIGVKEREILNENNFKNQDNKNKIKFFFLIFLSFLNILVTFFIHKWSGLKEGFESLPEHLVVKSDRSYRHHNYLRHINKNKVYPYRIFEVFNRKSYAKLKKLKFSKILFHFIKQYQLINKFCEEYRGLRISKLVKENALLNLAPYSFFLALFEEIKLDTPKINIFHSGSHLLALAANNSGISSTHLTHGLVINNLYSSYADDDHIYVYSKEEANFFEEFWPNAKVSIYPMQKVETKLKKITGFLQYESTFDDVKKKDLLDLLNFFNGMSYQVLVKPHPATDIESIKALKALSNDLNILEHDEISTNELLVEQSPMFTFGWSSTALCESLRSGIIPINLSPEDDEHMFMPYPFAKRALSWAKDKELIKGIVENKVDYLGALAHLIDQ